MIKFSKLFETVYEPRSGDEKNFKDKHVIAKHKYPLETESQFTSDKTKAKRGRDYDKGEDEAVYEAANVHTKRADKKPVIVRDVDAKTGQSRAHVELRRVGEINIGEEVDLDESWSDGISSRNAHMHAAKAADYRKKANTSASMAKHYDKGTPEHNKHMASYHSAMAKSIKSSYHAGDYGSVNTAKKDHKEHMDSAKEYKNSMNESFELEEGISDMSHGRLKWHMNTGVPHGSYSKAELKAERDRRLKTGEGEAYKNAKAGLNEDLEEKVKNPYAIGMAAAMKQAGDRPPLKKSTIVKGHEIAKSIKNEAMDKVGKEDSDIDNDGDTDKSDKYLHNRRKAIGKALRKEEVDQLDELSPNTLHKYIKKATPEVAARAISAVAPNQSAETKKHASKLGHRIKGIASASGRLADKANSDMYEEVELEENFKAGPLKLRDGSTVKLDSKDAMTLNSLFLSLNGKNQEKMDAKMMASSKGFSEILAFAKEAV